MNEDSDKQDSAKPKDKIDRRGLVIYLVITIILFAYVIYTWFELFFKLF